MTHRHNPTANEERQPSGLPENDNGIEERPTTYRGVAELVLDGSAQSPNVAQIYRRLEDVDGAVILHLRTTHSGTSIVCTVGNPSSFVGAILGMPKVQSWVLNYQ